MKSIIIFLLMMLVFCGSAFAERSPVVYLKDVPEDVMDDTTLAKFEGLELQKRRIVYFLVNTTNSLIRVKHTKVCGEYPGCGEPTLLMYKLNPGEVESVSFEGWNYTNLHIWIPNDGWVGLISVKAK